MDFLTESKSIDTADELHAYRLGQITSFCFLELQSYGSFNLLTASSVIYLVNFRSNLVFTIRGLVILIRFFMETHV